MSSFASAGMRAARQAARNTPFVYQHPYTQNPTRSNKTLREAASRVVASAAEIGMSTRSLGRPTAWAITECKLKLVDLPKVTGTESTQPLPDCKVTLVGSDGQPFVENSTGKVASIFTVRPNCNIRSQKVGDGTHHTLTNTTEITVDDYTEQTERQHQEQIAELDAALETAENNIQDLETQMGEMQQAHSEAIDKNFQEHSRLIDASENTVKDLQKQMREKNELITLRETEIHQFKETIIEWETSKTEWERVERQQQQAVSVLEERIRSLVTQAEELRTQGQELSEAQKRELQHLRSQLYDAQQEVTEAGEQAQALNRDLGNLREELKDVQEENRILLDNRQTLMLKYHDCFELAESRGKQLDGLVPMRLAFQAMTPFLTQAESALERMESDQSRAAKEDPIKLSTHVFGYLNGEFDPVARKKKHVARIYESGHQSPVWEKTFDDKEEGEAEVKREVERRRQKVKEEAEAEAKRMQARNSPTFQTPVAPSQSAGSEAGGGSASVLVTSAASRVSTTENKTN